MCRVLQARRKHQIAHESYKIEGVMHAVVYVDGALEAKCARDSSHKRFLKGAWSAQRAKRTSNGATRASKSDKNCYYRGRLGVKKVRFLMQEAWKLFKKCARHRGREALFEKSHQILEEKGAMSKASRHGRAEVHEMHTQERPRTGNACFSNGICKFLMAISVPNLAFFG